MVKKANLGPCIKTPIAHVKGVLSERLIGTNYFRSRKEKEQRKAIRR